MTCAPSLRARLITAWASVVEAWGVPAVRRGLVATVLVTLGSLSPAYLTHSSWLYRIQDRAGITGWPSQLVGTVLTMAGLLVLLDAWLRLRPRTGAHADGSYAYSHVRHWAILLIWGLPFVIAPPIFSHDAYSYAAQGWMVHNGINPYEVGPAVLPGAFADQVSWVWRDTPAPYGPLALQLQHLIVDLSGFRPYLSAVMMRVLSVVGVAAIGLLIPRIAQGRGADPARAAWFATLNPILVIDFIGGAHNDSLMMGLVVAALWVSGLPTRALTVRGRRIDPHRWGSAWWLLGAVLVGLGAAIKQPAFMAAYALPLISRPWISWRIREVAVVTLRGTVSVAVAIGTFILVTFATGLGFGWLHAVDVPGKVLTIAPFTVLGQGVQLILNHFHLDPTGWAAITVSRTLGVMVAAVTVAVLALTVARRHPMRFLSIGYLVVALCLPAVRSWYILWGGLLLPLANPSRRMYQTAIWVTIVLLSYNGINMAWRNNAMALGVAAAVGLWWLTAAHQRTLRRRRHERQEGSELFNNVEVDRD